jgi:hypothetical protein
MNKFITRRNVLRGAGICLALPFLSSLAPRVLRAQAEGTPKRFIPIYFPNGAAKQWWDDAPPPVSSVFNDGFQLNLTHAPLEPIKDKVLLVSHLGNWAFHDGPGQLEPSHSRCSAAVITCVDADAKGGNSGDGIANGISADQVIVQALDMGQTTPLASMQVGLGSFPGAFDGRSYAYNQSMSWKGPKDPLKRMINPKAVFDMLVASGAQASGQTVDPEATRSAQLLAARNKSVLDAVLDDADALKLKLSKVDQAAMEQFTTAFREVEMRSTQVGDVLTGSCSVIAEPFTVPEPPGAMQGLNQGQNGYDRAAHAKVMNELIAMAIQCDVTRVVSYMLDDARSEFDYNKFVGPEHRVFGDDYGGASNYHGGGQHGPDRNAGYALITRWLVSVVSELAQKLDAVPEGDGTVLDNTVMVMLNGMYGSNHDNNDIPILMIGGGGGTFKTNGHVTYSMENGSMRHTRDLFYTIQNEYFKAGVPSFGDHIENAPNALLEEILA